MYRIDLHVHSNRHSPCAELLDPARLIGVMTSCNLHGVVLAEHDVLWEEAELRALNCDDEIRIFRGVEVSSSDGHFVVIGLRDTTEISPGISAPDLIARVAEQDGAVIWAHPLCPPADDRVEAIAEQCAGLSAVEVSSTKTVGEQRAKARALAERFGWGGVAGSDAHALEFVGSYYTLFQTMPRDELELAAMIRAHKGVPSR